MTETRQANGVVGLTTFKDTLVLRSLHPEDVGKQERVVWNEITHTPVDSTLTTLALGMFGLWSGKLEPEDGPTPAIAIPAGFSREFTEETRAVGHPDIVLAAEQLRGTPQHVGAVEQIRPSQGRFLIQVFAQPLIELTWEQMNALAGRLQPGEELWEVVLGQAVAALEVDRRVRPTSVVAMQALLGASELWQAPKQWVVPRMPFNSQTQIGVHQA